MTAPVSVHRLPLALSILAALVALLPAARGIVDTGATYRPLTPEHMLPGALSQDIVSVAAAVCLIALALRLLNRPVSLLWLYWLGLTGYLLYAYALYVIDRLYNGWFLHYIAIVALAAWALIAYFSGPPVTVSATSPPRRITAALLAALALLFATLWLSIILPAMASRTPPEGHSIFVIDLTLVLPLLAVTATLLVLTRPMGDLLAIPVLIKAGTLGLSVLLGTLLTPAFGQPLKTDEIAIYAALGFLPLALIPFWHRRLITG